MRCIKNLILILLIVLAACSKQTSPERCGIRIEIGQEVAYDKAKSTLFIPVTFINKTCNDVDLVRYNFHYKVSDGETELQHGKNSGLGIMAGLMAEKSIKENEELEFIISENESVEFKLEVPIDMKEEILNKKELRIKLWAWVEEPEIKLLKSTTVRVR